MQFNDLLLADGIDPMQVLVMRHRPKQRELREVLPWFAAQKPEIFNAYQQSQYPRAEKALTKAKFLASFIAYRAAHALFIGLYRVGDLKPISAEEYWHTPANIEMRKFGLTGPKDDESLLWFDLDLTDFCSEYKGKLIVRYPPPERAWYRWASKNQFSIEAILEESALTERMPDWRDIVLSWDQLRVIPNDWKSKLSEWRGIYFIWDVSRGKGYVGAAYGVTNILGRWLNFAVSGDGGNRQLRKSKREDLRFTMLERVSPDMTNDEITRLESTWKSRLHTREHGLNLN